MPPDGIAEHRPGGTALRPITRPRALIGCLSLSSSAGFKNRGTGSAMIEAVFLPFGAGLPGCRPALPTLRHDQDRRCAHEPASRCRRPTRARRLVRPLSRCVDTGQTEGRSVGPPYTASRLRRRSTAMADHLAPVGGRCPVLRPAGCSGGSSEGGRPFFLQPAVVFAEEARAVRDLHHFSHYIAPLRNDPLTEGIGLENKKECLCGPQSKCANARAGPCARSARASGT